MRLGKRLSNKEIVEILYHTYIVLDPRACWPKNIIRVEQGILTIHKGEIYWVKE